MPKKRIRPFNAMLRAKQNPCTIFFLSPPVPAREEGVLLGYNRTQNTPTQGRSMTNFGVNHVVDLRFLEILVHDDVVGNSTVPYRDRLFGQRHLRPVSRLEKAASLTTLSQLANVVG